MPNFNINQPATPGQLAALFTGGGADPQAVQSNLFTTDSRLADWAQRSGNAAGIGDPVAFFRGQQAQQQMAQQQAYGDQAQLAGYDRNISPEFVRRNQFQSQLDAANQAREVASLQVQRQQALRDNPLPMQGYREAGGALPMAPSAMIDGKSYPGGLMGQAAAQGGITSDAYNLMRRAGGGNSSFNDTAGNPVNLISPSQKGAVDPETLYADPRFQMHAQHDPAHAAHLFEAYTGQKLADFAGQKAATFKEYNQHAVSHVQQAVEKGDIIPQPDGSALQMEYKVDALGKRSPTGKLIPLDAHNSEAYKTAVLNGALGQDIRDQYKLGKKAPLPSAAPSAPTNDPQAYARTQASAAQEAGLTAPSQNPYTAAEPSMSVFNVLGSERGANGIPNVSFGNKYTDIGASGITPNRLAPQMRQATNPNFVGPQTEQDQILQKAKELMSTPATRQAGLALIARLQQGYGQGGGAPEINPNNLPAFNQPQSMSDVGNTIKQGVQGLQALPYYLTHPMQALQ